MLTTMLGNRTHKSIRHARALSGCISVMQVKVMSTLTEIQNATKGRGTTVASVAKSYCLGKIQ